MTTQREKSCDERLPSHLRRHIEAMEMIAETAYGNQNADPDLDGEPFEADNPQEAADDRWMEYPLSVWSERIVIVQMSWGGPSDEFHVHVDNDGEITAITYWFKDWFDGASFDLSGRDFEIAEQFLQRFVDYETGEY
jgi:hypothetical protein